jgi:hypothetical protein
MKKIRTEADLSIHDGLYRSFEWYWSIDRTMPALDAYEALPQATQDDFISSIRHWGNVEPGKRAAQSRINQENESPLIVAVKAAHHRFAAFREPHGPTWIVCQHYVKRGERRDTSGDRAVKRSIDSRADYCKRVKEGTYYDRS